MHKQQVPKNQMMTISHSISSPRSILFARSSRIQEELARRPTSSKLLRVSNKTEKKLKISKQEAEKTKKTKA
jgi:hypothetical protein